MSARPTIGDTAALLRRCEAVGDRCLERLKDVTAGGPPIARGTWVVMDADKVASELEELARTPPCTPDSPLLLNGFPVPGTRAVDALLQYRRWMVHLSESCPLIIGLDLLNEAIAVARDAHALVRRARAVHAVLWPD